MCRSANVGGAPLTTAVGGVHNLDLYIFRRRTIAMLLYGGDRRCPDIAVAATIITRPRHRALLKRRG